ncbi:hypothetical protein ASD15_17285 [Massilia sp. Root351]|uniref:DUF4153 domain-containing protein n=1 Tax=Massilia sp. Root351 TaxID=1736522 RepID=UPI00070B98A4|nr:DUF4153 domain-containing protein [Massilia sp. Root351]KQV79960.1 hypothetical protein ASD15_17285 [Massilia sp. Root351]
MQADSAQTVLEATTTRSNGYLRLAAGLLQGCLLYLLHRANSGNAWPATDPLLFVPLLMASVLLPILLISSLGHIGGRKLALWMAVAAAVIVTLAWHDAWRRSGVQHPAGAGREDRLPSALVTVFSAAFFFIAHSLVMAGVQEGRRLAGYATYFETAWKLFIQAAFSVLFVAALWAMLSLGSGLFMLVKLDFLKLLLREAWFNAPVLCFAFACAMHITDVRPAIVRGIRTLLLVLMSWLLPVTVLLLAGFLGSLPFTGLETLWKTGHATIVLLGAAGTLVVLINAAYQNGEVEATVARAVRWSARIGALMLLPLVAIAIHALSLRVGDYGWSADRLIAAACLLVAVCYALGYACAAVQRGSWLRTLSLTNVGAAWLVLAVLLALFTPIADPARISVDSQMARLERGAVKADKFDYEYLKFEGARYGRAALERLKAATGPDAAIRRAGAAAALRKQYRGQQGEKAALSSADIGANLAVWPKGASLPESFPSAAWAGQRSNGVDLPLCLYQQGVHCDAFVLDLTGDGQADVLLVGEAPHVGAALLALRDGKWELAGRLPYFLSGCGELVAKLKAGQVKTVPKPLPDLEVDGTRIPVEAPERLQMKACK